MQLPVPPDGGARVGGVNVPGPLTLVKLIGVPAGAFTKPAVPSLTLTCAVNVCVWPTRFVAVAA